MVIYYNPDCSKCREALDLIDGSSCEISIREYLKDPPDVKELMELVRLLDCRPIDLVRKSEPIFLEKFNEQNYSDAEWFRILSEFPVLIERPIVMDGERAIIGRPPSLVLDLIKKTK